METPLAGTDRSVTYPLRCRDTGLLGERARVAESLAAGNAEGPRVEEVTRQARYLRADAADENDLRRLLDACEGRVIIYFALPPEIGPGALPPYGDVLARVLDGDPTLSVRGDAAVECWRIVEPVLAAWRREEVPLQDYPAGSTGPPDWPDPATGDPG